MGRVGERQCTVCSRLDHYTKRAAVIVRVCGMGVALRLADRRLSYALECPEIDGFGEWPRLSGVAMPRCRCRGYLRRCQRP